MAQRALHRNKLFAGLSRVDDFNRRRRVDIIARPQMARLADQAARRCSSAQERCCEKRPEMDRCLPRPCLKTQNGPSLHPRLGGIVCWECGFEKKMCNDCTGDLAVAAPSDGYG
jgi:hypothetical protein